jgi:hypothetical protein
VDPQSGSFFSSSNEANLDQLLKSQLAQLQASRGGVPDQFLAQHQRPSLSAQTAPAFQQAAPQFATAAQQSPDFGQFRAARQAPQPAHFHQQGALTPQSALVALQQQQQQDAQMLGQLRAQQLARLQEQARQAPSRAQPEQQAAQFQAQPQAFASQSQPLPVHQRAPAPESFAPQPQAVASPAASAAAVAAQPETFGPPVIDIRTLNYSIGQQTRV